MTLNHSGGLLLRWFRDTLCRWEREQARQAGEDAYDEILADTPDGPTDIFCLPHFAGSGTPWFDTSSTGAFLGLTFSTTRPVMAKAILEGLTFELRVNLDLLREAGLTIRELFAVGGGARSPLWLRLKADICRIPLRVPIVTDAACLGAALLCLAARGVYPDLPAAAGRIVSIQQRVDPVRESVDAYQERYRIYRKVYPALIDLHRQM
jgi:xylulokinase